MSRTLGVIIGRFQNDELTPGHKFLFDEVSKRHNHVAVLLGSKPEGSKSDKKNPLDFKTRKKMMLVYNPSLIISFQSDNETNPNWSITVDEAVDYAIDSSGECDDAILYGSRESFIPYYSGKFKTVEIETKIEYAATNDREKIAAEPLDTPDFRRGVIYNEYNRKLYSIPYAYGLVVNKSEGGTKIALTKNIGRNHFSLFGDFFDFKKDQSYPETTLRSIREQGGYNLELNPLKEYITDAQVNHWSCRSSEEKFHATFFLVEALWGGLKKSDGCEDVQWVTMNEFETIELVPELRPFKELLSKKIKEFNERKPLEVLHDGFSETIS